MKKLFLHLALLFFVGALSAQITVTNATFPVAGDTLRLVVSLNPGNLPITPAGGPYTWDYSDLSASSFQVIPYRPASEGSVGDQVPNAELVAEVTVGTEAYYNVTSTSFEWMAAYGADPVGFGLQALFTFTPPIPERHAPLDFIDNFTINSSLNLPFSTDLIPQEILDSLPVAVLPDSIRLRVTSQRNDLVDAYGTLAIPGGTYEVLREKRTELRETRIDVLVPFFGWQDVTDLILTGSGAFSNLGKDTIVTYNFFSAEVKEPIAIITLDAEEQNVTQVVYKDNGVVSGINDEFAAAGKVSVSPNPAGDVARFEFENWEPGNYDLRIFDLQGKRVFEKSFSLNTFQTELIPCEQFAPGTYFYQITNKGGKPATNGRFLKGQ